VRVERRGRARRACGCGCGKTDIYANGTVLVRSSSLTAAGLHELTQSYLACQLGKGLTVNFLPAPATDQLLLFRSFLLGHFSNQAQVTARAQRLSHRCVAWPTRLS
jgi:hypothetical protein